jgi:hypothetical protein
MPESATITLRALAGEPLADDRVRETVIATARALAERHGLSVLQVETDPDSATFTLNAGRIDAVGFAAELRRLTTRWYTQKYGETTLWGEADV